MADAQGDLKLPTSNVQSQFNQLQMAFVQSP